MKLLSVHLLGAFIGDDFVRGLNQSGAASETAETEELDENLLDDDDEDEEDAERSWKRNSREDEK